MRSLIIALQFMTRLPLPNMRAGSPDFAAAMRWFPLAGLIVGGAVSAGLWAGTVISPWVAALCGLFAWVVITGALHLDGLADVADAAGASHRSRERLPEVLADPHLGTFGVVAIVMQMAGKLVLLHQVAQSGDIWVLPAICCAARIGPLAWTLLLPPLHEGLGARFRAALGWHHLAAWSVFGASLTWCEPALAACVPMMWLWTAWVRSRLGGISGDSHGAGIEIIETCLLIAVVVS